MDDAIIDIVDAADDRVAEFRHLNDQATRRTMEADRFFISEGWVSIDRLIDSHHEFRSVLLSPSRVNRFRPFLAHRALDGVAVYVADRAVMAEIVGFDLKKAVLVAATRQRLETVDELVSTSKRVIVLEGLNDDENVGAIARAARAFDVDAILLSPTCTDPYHRRTVRTSMGEILHMRVARATADEWPGALDVLHRHGFESWALTPAGDAVDLWDAAVPERLALMLGAEGPGLSAAALGAATHRVRIPISAQVDSLNVGHAAAVALAATGRCAPAQRGVGCAP